MCSAQHPSLVHNLVHKLAWPLLVHNLVHKAQAVKLQKISCLLSCTICAPTVQDYFAYSIYCCIKTKYLSNEPRGTLKLSPPPRQSNRRLKFQKLFTAHNFSDSEPCAEHENVTFHTGLPWASPERDVNHSLPFKLVI